MGKKKSVSKQPAKQTASSSNGADKRQYLERAYPQVSLEEALKVLFAIRDKNNGNPWDTSQVADALGYTNVRTVKFQQLCRASQSFGLTVGTYTSPEIESSALGRRIAYPETADQERADKVKAFLSIDLFKRVHEHYGGSEFPERKYLESVLREKFGLAQELHDEFVRLFLRNCETLGIEKGLDADAYVPSTDDSTDGRIRVVGKAEGKFERTAFVIMPFAEKSKEPQRPTGYFNELLERLITPAGNAAGFAIKTSEQRGSDIIQSTIIQQLLRSDLVIADITDHNPNVLFELGIRIAKELPVALIRADGTDRIFDVDNMMRVLTYSSTLWSSAIQNDLPRLTDHIKAAWDTRLSAQSYMAILSGQPANGSIVSSKA
ncbi:MAG: hypothetical protein ACRCT8_15290 [Lacipirellulaceae bacterium]